MKTIEVIVKTDGSLEIDAVGFQGADCQKATAFLEKALGILRVRGFKAEYHARSQVQRKQQVGA